jgi:hypothetical protein
MYEEEKNFHGGLELHIWGIIGPYGGEALVKLEGRIDSAAY